MTHTANKKRENAFFSLIFNIIIPSFILSKYSEPEDLGPVVALIVALAFPVLYSIWDMFHRKDVSWIAMLGMVNVLLTGGFGLAKLEGIYFAIKEASIPSLLAITLWISARRNNTIIRSLLINDHLMDIPRIHEALAANGTSKDFEYLLRRLSLYMVCSFLLSAVLNFSLAYYLLESPTGSAEFNEELALMNLLSFPVIMLPCIVVLGASMYWFFRSLVSLTGLKFDDLIVGKVDKDKSKA